MSQRGGRPIDFQAWAQNQIVKRAVAALEARDEAFAERNADTPLPQLARYLSRCAISLGHSPSPSEVDGGTFIEQRFGSWAAAMAAARLPQPRSMRKLRDTARYKAEKVKSESRSGSASWSNPSSENGNKPPKSVRSRLLRLNGRRRRRRRLKQRLSPWQSPPLKPHLIQYPQQLTPVKPRQSERRLSAFHRGTGFKPPRPPSSNPQKASRDGKCRCLFHSGRGLPAPPASSKSTALMAEGELT